MPSAPVKTAAIALLALLVALPSSAANILTNGSFESGLSGWTPGTNAGCTIDAFEAGDPLPGFFGAGTD